jgi:hypothetical protein
MEHNPVRSSSKPTATRNQLQSLCGPNIRIEYDPAEVERGHRHAGAEPMVYFADPLVGECSAPLLQVLETGTLNAPDGRLRLLRGEPYQWFLGHDPHVTELLFHLTRGLRPTDGDPASLTMIDGPRLRLVIGCGLVDFTRADLEAHGVLDPNARSDRATAMITRYGVTRDIHACDFEYTLRNYLQAKPDWNPGWISVEQAEWLLAQFATVQGRISALGGAFSTALYTTHDGGRALLSEFQLGVLAVCAEGSVSVRTVAHACDLDWDDASAKVGELAAYGLLKSGAAERHWTITLRGEEILTISERSTRRR